MGKVRYNWNKANIKSGNAVDLKRALESAFTAIDDSIAQRAIDECCFITFRGSSGGRFVRHDEISGRHLIILREDYFSGAWADSRLEMVVPLILHELVHFALNHREADLAQKQSENQAEANKLNREWLNVWKKARGNHAK